MATVPTKNIELNRGEDYMATGWITDNNGNNVDISLRTFRAEVRDLCGTGSTLLASFTFTKFLDPVDGKYKYERTMAQAIINAIPVTNTEGVWDQFEEFTDGKSGKMLTGSVKINCNVTNPTV